MMKLVIIAVIISAAYADDTAEKLKCMKGAQADTLVEVECTSETTCTSPVVLADFTALSTQAYGCGTCADETTCKTCKTAKCNEKVMTETYDCANYAWSADDSKYAAPETMTKCMIVKSDDAKKICNMPGDEAKADKDYVKQHNGCGKCVDEKSVTDKKCKESSAVSMTALLLPLIAAFYTLF